MLIFMALSSYPVAFAQNVRLVAGQSSDDPTFQERWASALETLGGILSGRAAEDDSASTTPESGSGPARGRAEDGTLPQRCGQSTRRRVRVLTLG